MAGHIGHNDSVGILLVYRICRILQQYEIRYWIQFSILEDTQLSLSPSLKTGTTNLFLLVN